MNQYSLNTVINKRHTLTDNDIDQIIAIIGYRCRIKTINKLRFSLNWFPHRPNYGIYSRLIKENGKWAYICGQSWNDEMRTLRQCIIGG